MLDKGSNKSNTIDIVLASYNGGSYIFEQIESIRKSNKYLELVNKLYIVDDGSTDKTESIVKSFTRIDKKIIWVPKSTSSLGASQNFNRGLLLTNAPLVMLCDQDDIWYQSKIEDSFNSIKDYINQPIPTLAFSDVHVVDDNTNILSESYFKLKKIPKNWQHDFNLLIQQNTVSGCACIVNRALLELALPVPIKAYMHDWWLALVAKKFGKLIFIDKPLMAYRQHANNTIGARPITLWQRFKQHQRFTSSVLAVIEQAKEFQHHFADDTSLACQKSDTLYLLSNIEKLSVTERMDAIARGFFTRSHPIARLALLWVIMFKVEYKSNR